MSTEGLSKRNAWIVLAVFCACFIAADVLSSGPHFASSWMGLFEKGDVYGLATRAVGDAGMAIAFVLVCLKAYRRFLWKYDPGLRVPVLDKSYSGMVEYRNGLGTVESKDVDIRIEQEINYVKMKLYSSVTQSETLVGRFEQESGDPILYYVYRAKALTSDYQGGKVRMGAACLFLNVNGHLEGDYWTDDGRTGRLYFYRKRVGSVCADGSEKKSGPIRDAGVPSGRVGGPPPSGRENGLDADPILKPLCRTLWEVADGAGDDFSGTGIIVREEGFDEDNLASLRAGGFSGDINLFSERGVGFVLKSAIRTSASHDGFFVVGRDGRMEKSSQFLYPPRNAGVLPDRRRGTRSVSVLCGSSLAGVAAIGIVSEDKSIAVYRQGKCVYDSKDFPCKGQGVAAFG